MKLYGSFLIRCWLIRDEQAAQRTVFDVEHIQRGEHLRVSDLDEARQWMLQALQAGQTGTKPAEGVESETGQSNPAGGNEP